MTTPPPLPQCPGASRPTRRLDDAVRRVFGRYPAGHLSDGAERWVRVLEQELLALLPDAATAADARAAIARVFSWYPVQDVAEHRRALLASLHAELLGIVSEGEPPRPTERPGQGTTDREYTLTGALPTEMRGFGGQGAPNASRPLHSAAKAQRPAAHTERDTAQASRNHMIIWHTTLANVEDLKELAAAQLQAKNRDEKLRYSLEISSAPAHGAVASLTRHYRRPQSLGGGRVKEEIRLTPDFAARLHEVWPVSARAGRRAPQTTRSLLRLLAAPGPVSHDEAESRARQRRWESLRAAVARAWPTGAPPSAIKGLHAFLGGRMPMHAAIESDEGLACVLSFFAPHVDAAHHWDLRVRELAAEFVERFVALRLKAQRGRSAPDPAAVEVAVGMLAEHAQTAVGDGLRRARHQGEREIIVELGSTAGIMEVCLQMDAFFGWPTPTQLQNAEDLPRISELLHQLRDVIAAEVLTRP